MNDMAKNLLLWVIIAVVLLTVFQSFNPRSSAPSDVPYSEFAQQVTNGGVASAQFASDRPTKVTAKLKEVIPRQNFQVALQAAIGARFIAREDLSAYRKDVTTGLYGGDVSRKKKVLAKQKKGKERMKKFGRVDIPAEAFTVMLKRD